MRYETSTVPASRTIANLERKLVEIGVRELQKQYDPSGRVDCLVFKYDAYGKVFYFKFPARVSRVEAVMKKKRTRITAATAAKIGQQAERTAWKLVEELFLIQLAMIDMDQVQLMEVLLPYVVDPQTQQTFFEKLDNQQFKQLSA